MITRTHLAIYALPALALLAFRVVRDWRSKGWPRTGLALVLLTAPAASGALQVALVNRWMTGGLTQSTYVFGAGAFRSLEFMDPEFPAVLVHPWHGLLTYHPLYGICFLAVLILAWQSPQRWDRPLWLAVAGLVLVQLYIQAVWFAWWLGMQTFGMRGMAVTALGLVPALIRLIARDCVHRPALARMWVVLMLGACTWSYLLLLQGTTSFYTYRALLAAQLRQALALLRPETLALLLGTLIVSLLLLRGIHGEGRLDAPDRLVNQVTVILTFMTVSSLLPRLVARPIRQIVLFGCLVLIGTGLLLTSSLVLHRVLEGRIRAVNPNKVLTTVVGIGLALTCFLAGSLFANLALRTERHIAAGGASARAFDCVSGVLWDEIRESYREYLRIDGFDEKKNSLRDFLHTTGGRVCPSLALPAAQ